jgi:hypothetical protein
MRQTKTWKVRCEKCGVVAEGIKYNEDANKRRGEHSKNCDSNVVRTVAR